MANLKILGIAGSLREGSFNRAALNAAREHSSEFADIEIFENLGEIPPFNQDFENALPDIVTGLKEKIRNADAVIFATPEYNYSFPGVLKNAIDWASRPYGDNSWDGKPAAIMSASVGMLGGSRAQYQLRQTFIFLNMFPLNQPEVIIPDVTGKVDEQGHIIDEHTLDKIKELVQSLVQWSEKLNAREVPQKEIKKEQYPYDNAYRDSASPGM